MNILFLHTKKRETGDIGERAAAKYLRFRKHYRILERNYVAAGAEIDLIAGTKTHDIFVEVKTRTAGHEDPRESRPAAAVTKEKQRHIFRAAKVYLARRGYRKKVRFDIVEVTLDEKGRVQNILHMENAFTADTCR